MGFSVCFVSETSRDRPILDPSVRYRCFHPAEELARRGITTAVYSAAQFYQTPNYDFDAYIFHRPSSNRAAFESVIDRLKTLKRVLVADYDDLVFGGAEIALNSSSVKNQTMAPQQAILAYEKNLVALRAFSTITTSTSSLAAKVRELNPGSSVTIVANRIPESVMSLHIEGRTYRIQKPPHRIGYFAGTKSHDADIAVIVEVLHRVLLEQPRTDFLVVGPVALPFSLSALQNVHVMDAIGYWRVPGLMSDCATVIAPLEDSGFNQCKSRVKFLEAALAGCRLIASPIPDMKELGEERLVLPSSLNDWYEALSLRLEADAQRDLANANFDYLYQNCHAARSAEQIVQVVGG